LDQCCNKPAFSVTSPSNNAGSFRQTSTIPDDKPFDGYRVNHLLTLPARSLVIDSELLSGGFRYSTLISLMNKFLERGQEVSYGLQACETFLEVG
jgi:hypothetical protein